MWILAFLCTRRFLMAINEMQRAKVESMCVVQRNKAEALIKKFNKGTRRYRRNSVSHGGSSVKNELGRALGSVDTSLRDEAFPLQGKVPLVSLTCPRRVRLLRTRDHDPVLELEERHSGRSATHRVVPIEASHRDTLSEFTLEERGGGLSLDNFQMLKDRMSARGDCEGFVDRSGRRSRRRRE